MKYVHNRVSPSVVQCSLSTIHNQIRKTRPVTLLLESVIIIVINGLVFILPVADDSLGETRIVEPVLRALRPPLKTRGWYHGGRRPSSDDSLHSPTVIPPSALGKPSIMKRYHRRWTCSHTSHRRSPMMVTIHYTGSVCRVPMVEWRLDYENCRHLTVVDLHDTGPRMSMHSDGDAGKPLSLLSLRWRWKSRGVRVSGWITFHSAQFPHFFPKR